MANTTSKPGYYVNNEHWICADTHDHIEDPDILKLYRDGKLVAEFRSWWCIQWAPKRTETDA